MSTCEEIMAAKLETLACNLNYPHWKTKDFLQCYNKVSRDTANDIPLVDDASHKVINFDLIGKLHRKRFNYPEVNRTNDAIFFSDDEIIFIEFKRGKIFHDGVLDKSERRKLKEKNFTSLLFAIDVGWIASVKESRERVKYVLVYSQDNGPADITPSRDEVRARIRRNSSEKSVPRELAPMSWIFNDLSMCSECDFLQKFIPGHYMSA